MEDIIEKLKPRVRKQVQKLEEEPVIEEVRVPTPPKKEIPPYVRKHISISDQTYSEIEHQSLDRIEYKVNQLNPGKNFSMGWGRQDILVDDSLAGLAKVHEYCKTEFKEYVRRA
mmetsp:Transcript_28851/g.51396  ORF Transcript_28851/g.51396 Transcript_28851/m.51396 type:complete len:114 (-) Transcript_28851:4844-5185(-)|eukprot:CAMPEP_0204905624 /NCGR_PEP_ID=MMETSP1397-20131031/5527_1 /ASSEMBLY_ACC=CAM_ASM_000891 /TAXON_ID=49980 /ORGANISM="Climacostomum Climacostomum virens, Strain Stock W-24" /LENGTH=113 /DNA_ID=CAMNT_0052074529 /DNA_START=277 /DNA_END=618 /DNA_ORIENTATION=-